MVKIYNRYGLKSTFGIITSLGTNAVFDATNKCAITGALEEILIWDLRQATQVTNFSESPEVNMITKRPFVTSIAFKHENNTLAAGYSNGMIVIWNTQKHRLLHHFEGHKSQVNSLAFDEAGYLLVSGSNDTNLIIWDLVAGSGMFKLRGHKNAITQVCFYKRDRFLVISSSKDTFVKFWDIDTQHCIQTIVGHHSEVWSFDIDPQQKRMATVSQNILRFYRLDQERSVDITPSTSITTVSGRDDNVDVTNIDRDRDNDTEFICAEYFGSIELKAKGRGSMVRFNCDGSILAVQMAGKHIEFFECHSSEDAKQRSKIRYRRLKHRLVKQYEREVETYQKLVAQSKLAIVPVSLPPEPNMSNLEQSLKKDVQAVDEFSHNQILSTIAKIQSIDFSSRTTSDLLLSLSNNTLEHYKIFLFKRDPESSSSENQFGKNKNESGENDEMDDPLNFEDPGNSALLASSLITRLDLAGNRSDIRSLALTKNDEMLVSTSSNLIKIWNVRTRVCVRTMTSGYGLSVSFVPGDRHLLLGTKTGEIELFDIQAAELLETKTAHSGPIWALKILRNGSGFITVSADKMIKFWRFELIKSTDQPIQSSISLSSANMMIPTMENSFIGSSNGSTTRITFTETHSHEMPDDILHCKFSHDNKYLALALLDSTVRILDARTLKPFHTLYGHKLPVMSLDISDDSALIVTGSVDKNIRLWGMDFGDCHRSLFAHENSVMQVAFVPRTHYFFSSGKDGVIKYWDADIFERILTLPGHHGEIWAMAMSSNGDFVVTGSHDRSMRIWSRSEEQLVIEDERDNEVENQWEIAAEIDEPYVAQTPLDDTESTRASKITLESIKSGEQLLDALEIVQVEEENWNIYHQDVKRLTDLGQNEAATAVRQPPKNGLLLGKSCTDFLVKKASSIRKSDLEESLLLLPLNHALRLIEYIDKWMDNSAYLEISTTILHLLLQTHYNQIAANKRIQKVLYSIKTKARKSLEQYREMMGFNLVAMSFMRRELEFKTKSKFFQEIEQDFIKLGQKRQKKLFPYWE